MSVFSQFFTTSSGATATIHYTQASKMAKAWARSNYLAVNYQGSGVTSAVQSFHDAVNYSGISDDTNFGVDTYKTIANVSGAGFCSAIVGPALLRAASSTVFLCNFNGVQGQTSAAEYNGKTLTFSGDGGGAVLSTTEKKYGSASLYMASGTKYVSSPASVDFNFGTGDWTIECWVRFTSTTGVMAIFGQYSAGNNDSWMMYKDSFHNLAIGQTDGAPGTLNWTWNPSTNVWIHIAICKSSGTIRAFADGVQLTLTAGSASDASSWGTSTDTFYIGREVARNNDSQFLGYIDDVRILKGSAAYTAGFTPPTEFPYTYDSTTIRVTVDGGTPEVITMNTLDFQNVTYGTRALLGYLHLNDANNRSTAWRLTSDKTTVSAAGTATTAYICDVLTSLEQNQPILRFETSLLVEMKTSVAVTGTTNQERRSGVVYKLD